MYCRNISEMLGYFFDGVRWKLFPIPFSCVVCLMKVLLGRVLLPRVQHRSPACFAFTQDFRYLRLVVAWLKRLDECYSVCFGFAAKYSADSTYRRRWSEQQWRMAGCFVCALMHELPFLCWWSAVSFKAIERCFVSVIRTAFFKFEKGSFNGVFEFCRCDNYSSFK